MKKLMMLITIGAAGLILLLGPTTNALAYSIVFDPVGPYTPPTSLNTIHVKVNITSLGSNEAVSAFDIGFSWNPTILSLSGVALLAVGPNLPLGALSDVTYYFNRDLDLGTASVGVSSDLSEVALLALQSPLGGTFPLLDLAFSILQHTESSLTFQEVNIVTTQVPVPEPATMLLLASGLVGLAGFRRLRRN